MGILRNIITAGIPQSIYAADTKDALGSVPAEIDGGQPREVSQLAESIQYALDRGAGLTDTLGNQPIRASRAIEIAASYRCISLIAGSIGRLPAYIEGPDGYKIKDYRDISNRRFHQLAGLLFSGKRIGGLYFLPDLLKQIASDLALWGNSFLCKIPEQQLIPNDLEYVPAWGARTEIKRSEIVPDNIKLFYQLHPLGGAATKVVAANNLIHASLSNLRGVSNDNYLGTAPLQAIATSVSISKSAERFVNAYFESGGFGNNAFILLPDSMKDDQAVEVERRLHRKVTQGGLLRRMFTVIGGGATVVPMTTDSQSAAMMQVLQTLTENVARVYGVPGSLVGIKTTEVGTGLEELTKIFVRFSLAHYREAIENSISYSLFENKYKFRLDISAFSAADLKSMSTFITATVGDAQRPPIMTREELRNMIDAPQDGPMKDWEPTKLEEPKEKKDDDEK